MKLMSQNHLPHAGSTPASDSAICGAGAARPKQRIEWIDHAKGICICLVVMLYSVEWVEDAMGRPGWLHLVVDFAKPFRMPAFFLISGLLLSATIGSDWRTYIDRKVIHFAYFYVLWLNIGFLLRGPWMAADSSWPEVGSHYLASYVHPFAMLWFIYLLPVFFVATRLLRPLAHGWVWLGAAAIHLASPHTGIDTLDKSAQYYVFFYSGYAFAPALFKLGQAAADFKGVAIPGLLLWAGLEAFIAFSGDAPPFAPLLLGYLGAAGVIVAASLLSATSRLSWLKYCGRQSLVIYLAFFIPLMFSRAALTRLGVIQDVGTASLLVTALSVAGALAMALIVRGTAFGFLFERPRAFVLAARKPLPQGASPRGSTPSGR